MSETKHTPTPGPWHVNPRHPTLVEVEDRSQTVANTSSWQSNTRDLEELAAEQEANARLCAAAPDLLAAAESVSESRAEYKAMVDGYGSASVEAEVAERVLDFALVDLNAAIAKAKGQADE